MRNAIPAEPRAIPIASARQATGVEGLAGERVVPELRHQIVEGRLPPGSRLSELAIAEHFGVSRTPVREAFRQLEREGLILMTLRAGAHVRNIDARDVEELYETREALETQAARLAARRITPVGSARLAERIAALAPLAQPGSESAYTAELDQFYDLLMALAGNTTLRRSYEALSGPVRMLRRVAMRKPGRILASFAHAQSIVAAINTGDEDFAEREMRAQLLTARDAVVAVLAQESNV